MHSGRREAWTLASLFWFAMFMVGLVLSTGCESINETFLRGEEAAHSAVAPIYAAYVTTDVTLSEQAKVDRLRTLTAWQFSLRQARKSVNGQD